MTEGDAVPDEDRPDEDRTGDSGTGVPDDAVVTEAASESPSQPLPARLRGRDPIARLRGHAASLLVAALAVAVAVAGSVYWWLYRPDQLTGQAAQDEVLAAAAAGTEAVLTYAPDSVDQNLADAKSHLTGDFLKQYGEFGDTVIRPATKERGVKTEANVARKAVSSIQPNQAQVLVFVNQVTTSKGRPTPALATSTVMLTLVRGGDGWLISEFKPL